MKTNHLRISIFVILSFVLLISCKNEEKKSILVFSVKIENPNGDSLFIEDPFNGKPIRAFYLENGELIKDTINIPMGYYRIDDGTETILCFLKPNFDLHLTLNTKEFDKSIVYSGTGENENNYLAEKHLLEKSFQNLNYYGYFASLEEKEFIILADSIYNTEVELFNKHKNSFDQDFSKLEFEHIKIRYLTKLANYEAMKCFVTDNKEFSVSKDFPKPYNNIQLDNESLLLVPGYIDFVVMYIQELSSIIFEQDKSISYFNLLVDLIDSELQNNKIKEEAAYFVGQYTFHLADDKEYCYGKLKEMISNPEYLKPMEETYSKTKKRIISPTFELYDIDSNLVKLEDFKGKLVYIDIWATWCSPCIKEIPDLDNLQTEFKDKDIVFISICQNDDQKIWKTTVLTEKLQGIHLFVHEKDNKFLTDYQITGIPRFILIDENGFIIDSDALRPSDPALKEQLDKFLK